MGPAESRRTAIAISTKRGDSASSPRPAPSTSTARLVATRDGSSSFADGANVVGIASPGASGGAGKSVTFVMRSAGYPAGEDLETAFGRLEHDSTGPGPLGQGGRSRHSTR